MVLGVVLGFTAKNIAGQAGIWDLLGSLFRSKPQKIAGQADM
jgi:hypothetical protein